MSADPVAIIAAVSGGAVAIITAYGAIQAKRIHTLVNSKNDALLARVDQLADELRERGDGTVPKAPVP